MGSSKVKQLRIQFDRKNGTYLPGELVSGQVFVEFSKAKQIKGIRIIARGESVVGWSVKKAETNDRGENTCSSLSGYEEYFCSEFYLLGSGSGSHLTLPPGQLAYPFKFHLPFNVPNSFKHEVGSVQYTVNVLFDGPWKTEHQVNATFNVASTYDLNEKPGATIAIEEKVKKSFGCLCVCMDGKLFATISVPASGFATGQTIPVTVYCENESTVDVAKIKVSLVEKIKFHAKNPRWETKEENVVVASEKCHHPFVNSSEEYVTLNLRVPPLPPTGLELCGLIDLEYLLTVNIAFSGFHCSIERSFPIVIGTVPLYSFSNVAAMPPPTAPQMSEPSFQTPQFHGMVPVHVVMPQQQVLGCMQNVYSQQTSPYDPNLMNQHYNTPPPYQPNVQMR